MRVGIRGLHRTLLRCQLGAKSELVVQIAGAFGKHCRKDIDIGTYGLRSRAETRREGLREITGSGMKGAVKTAIVFLEHVAVRDGRLRSNVNDVKPAAGRDFQMEFEG